MVKHDTPGDRKLARYTGNAIALVGQAIEDGSGGLLKRLGAALRDTASMPFLEALARQAQQMVPPERLAAPETGTAMAEVVEDLEKEIPDKRRLEILRRAFLGVAIGDASDPDGFMGLAFLQVARRLTGLQAQVLGAAYRVRNLEIASLNGSQRVDAWRAAVASAAGIPHVDLLHQVFKELANNLLAYAEEDGEPRHLKQGRGALSGFGLTFCEFLQRVEPFPEQPPPQKPTS